jgi:hypothetical protein
MTWAEKDARREARRYGLAATVALGSAIAWADEARAWQRIEDAADRVEFWQQRSNRALTDAHRLARKAGHAALQAQALRGTK